MFKYITAAFMLAASSVYAGEIKPVKPADVLGESYRTKAFCINEQDLLNWLDNWSSLRAVPANCFLYPPGMEVPTAQSNSTIEYRYLDDEGDETLIIAYRAQNGETAWTFIFEEQLGELL
jgi:hypothetical protein